MFILINNLPKEEKRDSAEIASFEKKREEKINWSKVLAQLWNLTLLPFNLRVECNASRKIAHKLQLKSE